MTRIQRYSSYTFSAFLAAHVTNTSLIPLLTRSVQSSDAYLLLTRPYYRECSSLGKAKRCVFQHPRRLLRHARPTLPVNAH